MPLRSKIALFYHDKSKKKILPLCGIITLFCCNKTKKNLPLRGKITLFYNYKSKKILPLHGRITLFYHDKSKIALFCRNKAKKICRFAAKSPYFTTIKETNFALFYRNKAKSPYFTTIKAKNLPIRGKITLFYWNKAKKFCRFAVKSPYFTTIKTKNFAASLQNHPILPQ